MLEQINQSEDSIKKNTTYTNHLLITVPLIEGEPKVNQSTPLHFAMMKDLTVEQSKIPTSKQIKCSPLSDWISPTLLHKAPHLYRR